MRMPLHRQLPHERGAPAFFDFREVPLGQRITFSTAPYQAFSGDIFLEKLLRLAIFIARFFRRFAMDK